MNKYDPNTKYGWDKDTQFSLSGDEFGLILNTFRTVLGTPEAQKILLLNRSNNTMEAVLQRNVESGNVTPTPVPEEPISKQIANMQVVEEDIQEVSEIKKPKKVKN